MKFAFFLPLLFLLSNPAQLSAQPAVKSTEPSSNQGSITHRTTLRYDKRLAPLADYICLYMDVTKEENYLPGNQSIALILDPSLIGEAYRLTVKPTFIEIAGGSYGGVFNGIQALMRLLPPKIYTQSCRLPLHVPCGIYADAPQFTHRGMMLDVARTWMGEAEVKRYIDLLSYHNINKLHLHLTDDEGWRIEIKSHPELTQIGGYRGGDSPIRPVYGKWGEKYGGYFTQQQMRAIIRYAAVRNIEIIPEIDLPGHSRDIASVHPEIRCNYPPDLASTNGYDYRSAWCVAREANYALLKDILDEICDLFPSHQIHIGGDEVDMTQWTTCPDCRKLMQQKGMNDPHQLEDLFMERVAKILSDKGKQPAVWNEAVRTGLLSHDCHVYGWENAKACLDATAKGYKTVVMPAEYFYFDMRQSPEEAGHDWAAVFDTRKTAEFDFAKAGFSPEQMAHVIGLQGAFWSEAYISHHPEKPDYIDYMCFPRICALSRIAWSGQAVDWAQYYRELTEQHYDRMTAMGIRFRLSPPQVQCDSTGRITASVDDQSKLYYTVEDGEIHRYRHPLHDLHPEQVTIFSQRGTGRSPEVHLPEFYQTITPAVTITTSMGEETKYPYTNAANYKGMSRTRRACRQQDWILYTFRTPIVCREIQLQTGNRQLPKTIITTGYAEVSYDGTTFERIGNLNSGRITFQPTQAVHAARIISTCDDNGTPWVTIQPPRIKPLLESCKRPTN